MNERTVAQYARQMKDGSWQMNGESIKLDENNELIDGQHRLAAVVQYGQPVEMMVTFGIPSGAIKTIDTGKPRSVADHLKIHGFDGDLLVAAAVRVIKDFQDGVYSERKERMTPTETILFCDKNKGLFHSMDRITTTTGVFLPKSVAVGLHFVFSQYNPNRAEEFFAQLASGANLGAKNPVLTLRNRLIAMQSEGKRGSGTRRMYISFAVQAFNAFCAGKEVGQMQYRSDSEIKITV
jgi:hypothetical protein